MAILKTLFSERFKISEERLDICRKCEHFEPDSEKCNECGCYMAYKSLLPYAECPLKKWEKYGPEE